MILRKKILFGVLIFIVVAQAAFINYLIATAGIVKERHNLLEERVEIMAETASAAQELAELRLRVCCAYKATLSNVFERLGLDEQKSATFGLLEVLDGC